MLTRGRDGKPVSAEVSLAVVDEAIFAVRPDLTEDIWSAFYPRRWHDISSLDSLHFSFYGASGQERIRWAAGKPATTFADIKGGVVGLEPDVRKYFPDTLYWGPHVVTDARGQATVRMRMPDSLTTWRATARAVTAGTQVGSGIQKSVTRKNVIARVATPRLLRRGDAATVSVIAHNFLPAAQPARISLQGEGVEVGGAAERQVTLPARGQARLDFPVRAAAIGTATVRARVLTDQESDAVELALPIRPQGSPAVEARRGVLEGDATKVETMAFPPTSVREGRELRIHASPSLALSILPALDYLAGFPYGCTEQTMSRFLPSVIVSQARRAPGLAFLPPNPELPRMVREGVEKLARLQHEDGGWGWWDHDATDLWMTAYVVHGLGEARQAGPGVDARMLSQGREALRKLLKGHDQVTWEQAYGYLALAVSGKSDRKELTSALRRRDRLDPYGLALLTLALHRAGLTKEAAALAAEVEAAGVRAAGEAYWPHGPRGAPWRQRDVEATAFAVKALAVARPQSRLLPEGALWLAGRRVNGAWWDSTRTTALAVYGLLDYLEQTRELEADFTLEIRDNDRVLRSLVVTPESLKQPEGLQIVLRGSELGDGTHAITLVKKGRGRLYYSVVSRQTVEEERPPSASMGVHIRREYQRLRILREGDRYVYRAEAIRGAVKPGDELLVTLTVRADGDYEHVLIEDGIPSDAEGIADDSRFRLAGEGRREGRGWRWWYAGREIRDDRVALFATRLARGEHRFQYFLKAVVPGTFWVPPARAELMYHPEVQGRSDSETLRIAGEES